MSDDKNISYQPTDGLTYDPSDARYFDAEMIDKEVRRAFEICHGCRRCFKYCDSFPILFRFLDEDYDGDVKKLETPDVDAVMDACFQCKLCEVECPYTPRDGHEFQLDFPKLVHRYHAKRRERQPAPLRDRMLSDPDGAARFARMSLGLANALNKVRAHRWFMEKALGIHRDKQLPDFARKSFSSWAEKNGKTRDEPKAEVVLFPTCYVENNEPDIGRDVVKVMEKNHVDMVCGRGQQCCGMPKWESGDLEGLREAAHANLDVLMPYVENGAKVMIVNPTCSMTMRREYPELLEGEDRARAEKLSEAVVDCGEYLWSIRNEERFNTDFKSTPGPVSYHAPCHLRAQAIGFKGRDLLRKIPEVTPKFVLECCGHDGTYAMKVESFEASARIGQRSFDGMKGGDAEVWATECPLAAIQFEQHAGTKAMHPMSILARAYEPDGFPTAVEPKDGAEDKETS